jgi:hypothetical protein
MTAPTLILLRWQGHGLAVLGNSMGGFAVLYAVDRDLAAKYFRDQFRAAVVVGASAAS